MTRTDQLLLDEAQVYCPRLRPIIRAAIDDPRTSRQVIGLMMAHIKQLDMALQSLTPGGSEFVGEPARCVDYVRDRLNSSTFQQSIVHLWDIETHRQSFTMTRPRYQILQALQKAPRSTADLREKLHMSGRCFEGAFAFSLNALTEAGLVKIQEDGVCEITQTGRGLLK